MSLRVDGSVVGCVFSWPRALAIWSTNGTTAGRHARGDPCAYLRFQPCDSVCGQADRSRKGFQSHKAIQGAAAQAGRMLHRGPSHQAFRGALKGDRGAARGLVVLRRLGRGTPETTDGSIGRCFKNKRYLLRCRCERRFHVGRPESRRNWRGRLRHYSNTKLTYQAPRICVYFFP